MNKGCKPFVWWESPLATIQVQIGNSSLFGIGIPWLYPIWSLGNPSGHGIQLQGKGILFHYIHQISELF